MDRQPDSIYASRQTDMMYGHQAVNKGVLLVEEKALALEGTSERESLACYCHQLPRSRSAKPPGQPFPA